MSLMAMLAAAAIAAAPADPLAPARDGQMQCYRPDTVNRTCGQLVSYAFDGHGGIVEKQEMLLVAKPLLVMRSQSSVALRDGAVCGLMAKSDIDTATITLDGNPAPDDLVAKVRAQLLETDGADLGKEGCTSFPADGDHFAARVAIAGVDRPELTVPVIWVKPDDGYKLGGAP